MNSFFAHNVELKDEKIIEMYNRYSLVKHVGLSISEIDNMSEEDYNYFLTFLNAENKYSQGSTTKKM